MRKAVTILAVSILLGTLLIGAVVGQKESNVFNSQVQKGVQLTYSGIASKALTYKGELVKFNLNVENFGGYEIKVNVDKEVSGDTGYFITWLDKKGFTITYNSGSSHDISPTPELCSAETSVSSKAITVSAQKAFSQNS